MKRKLIMLLTSISIGAMLSVGLVGCSNSSKETGENITPVTTSIILSDDEIKIDGEGVSLDENKINV
ncbi:MAG: hypothetical protein E7214_15245 [Clostridium sp.]|nr:hypothetical protein [Clostridium sp.]